MGESVYPGVTPIKMPITIAIIDGLNITSSINRFMSPWLKSLADSGVAVVMVSARK